MDYRTAAQFGSGQLELQLIDKDGIVDVISNPSFSSTGGWKNWTTTSEFIQFPAGRYTMRILITQAPFNLNWLEFSIPTSTKDLHNNTFTNVKIFPNPSNDLFNVQAKIDVTQDIRMNIFNKNGKLIQSRFLENSLNIQEQISLENHPSGLYFLILQLEDGNTYAHKLIRTE